MAAGCSVGSCQNREHLVHHVFLSFRGEDVRKSFVDHLRLALNQKEITAFCDNMGPERDEEIQWKLYEAIESSKIAIVTFSSTYATSGWCLDELMKIMEHRSDGLIYDVDPTTVRHQSGPYQEAAFQGHEVKYEGEIHGVTKWRQALTSAAGLAGLGLQNIANGHEAEVIEHNVEVVLQKSGIELGCPPLSFTIFPSSLKRLILSNCDIFRDDVMEMISCAPSLEYVDLSHNSIHVMSDIKRGLCLKLRFLLLASCGISSLDVVMEMISCTPSLEHLDLSHNTIRVMSNMNMGPRLKLKSLILANCGVSRDDVLEMINYAPSLKYLDLSHNPIIHVIAPTSRGPCLKLKSLNLDDCPNLQLVSDVLQGCSLSAKHCDSLKKIKFYKQLIEANDFQKLVEFEYAVIEPTNEMKEEHAMHLGFPKLNSFDYKNMGCDESGWGIYQAGMYCVYLGGDHMAQWFPATTTFRGRSAERYTVPSCYPNQRTIRALNVGFVGTQFSYTLVIKNVGRMWKWIYSQPWKLPFGGEEMEEEVTWLTHWCVTERRKIAPGDELEISASGCQSLRFKVIFEEEEEHIDGEGAKDDSAPTSGVAVWYNDTFRSHDLSLYLQEEVKQEKDEENSCEYHINPHLDPGDQSSIGVMSINPII